MGLIIEILGAAVLDILAGDPRTDAITQNKLACAAEQWTDGCICRLTEVVSVDCFNKSTEQT